MYVAILKTKINKTWSGRIHQETKKYIFFFVTLSRFVVSIIPSSERMQLQRS